MNLFSLDGQNAFITGASSGIGAHLARVFHGAGARVALAARREGQLTTLAGSLGEGAVAVPLDVTDGAAVARAFDAAEASIGLCDIVVNAAGIAVTAKALDFSDEDWDAVQNVDLRGAFLVSREAARRLVAAGMPGSIIQITSILAERVMPGVAPYLAAKAGLAQLSRGLAVEWARHGIRVNMLAPGYVQTEINAGFFETEAGAALVRRIPQRRIGTLGDLTGPALLLASRAGAHMTGSTIVVDGGHSIGSL